MSGCCYLRQPQQIGIIDIWSVGEGFTSVWDWHVITKPDSDGHFPIWFISGTVGSSRSSIILSLSLRRHKMLCKECITNLLPSVRNECVNLLLVTHKNGRACLIVLRMVFTLLYQTWLLKRARYPEQKAFHWTVENKK